MALSMDSYIYNDDFEGAIERYEQTSLRWKSNWWNVIVTIYNKVPRYKRKYTLNFKEKTVVKLPKEKIDIFFGTKNNFPKGTKICYLFKFYDTYGNIIFSKIGTTERTVDKRISEEIKSYSKNYDIASATIESMIDCGTLEPEGAESICRAEFIKKYEGKYLKNDRFLGVDISVEDFYKIVYNYLTT